MWSLPSERGSEVTKVVQAECLRSAQVFRQGSICKDETELLPPTLSPLGGPGEQLKP
jgi:hypothetical protein